MELVLSPAFRAVAIRSDSRCFDLPLSEDGSFTLPQLSPTDGFSILVDGSHLCRTTTRQLEDLDRSITVLDAHTALRAYDLRPSGTTRLFYRNDRQIVLLVRYGNVVYDCPVVLSWYRQVDLVYSEVILLPQQSQPGGERTHGRSVAILPDIPKGEWRVVGHLMTGRQLFELPFHLLDRDRAAYGQTAAE